MEWLSLLRTLGALAIVLGGLAGALWLVRRYDIALPGRIGAGRTAARRIAVIERIAIDARRSAVLLRHDDREHLILLLPDGAKILERRIVRDEPDPARAAAS